MYSVTIMTWFMICYVSDGYGLYRLYAPCFESFWTEKCIKRELYRKGKVLISAFSVINPLAGFQFHSMQYCWPSFSFSTFLIDKTSVFVSFKI